MLKDLLRPLNAPDANLCPSINLYWAQIKFPMQK
jgi:hypothetical protein